MRVLMFGWEFPPYMAGGLGTACYGLTKAMSKKNVSICFVMPQGPDDPKAEYVRLIVARPRTKFKIKKITSLLRPYSTDSQYNELYAKTLTGSSKSGPLYGKDIYQEVYRYAMLARAVAEDEEFDIIHCHDWMTFPAGIEAKKVSGRPLVVHVHATEFDRTGGNGVNQYVYDIERNGMHAADRVIAISNFVKDNLMRNYGVPESKIVVIHNGIDLGSYGNPSHIKNSEKIVLFLGRLTLQKGPDYLIEAAKKVIDYDPDVKFIMVGNGDMEFKLINRVAQLGIGKNVLFAGWLSHNDIDIAYKNADLFVMPSVSEPFGLTPLEALRNNVPVIISKQSGVSEVLKNALKVDFWDVDELANKILTVLNYRSLHQELKNHGSMEVQNLSWDAPVDKMIQLYDELVLKPVITVR